MKEFKFILPGEPLTRKGERTVQGFLTALSQDRDPIGAGGRTAGLGFTWVSNKKSLNRLVMRTRKHLIVALTDARLLSVFPENLYNMEQRVNPAHGSEPFGTIFLKEE